MHPLSVSVLFEEGDSESYDCSGVVIGESGQDVTFVGSDSEVLFEIGADWKAITIDRRGR